eukprot:445362_1
MFFNMFWDRIISLRNRKITNKKKKTHDQQPEQFIIEFNHQTSDVHIIDECKELESCVDIRRVVFVSLHGLYKTWKKCPPHVLYSALLIMPLRREWIYDHSKYHDEWHPFLSVNGLRPFWNRKSEERDSFYEFLQLLRWKDSQELIFFMRDELDPLQITPHDLTAPFWKNLSMRLTAMYDPVTGGTYQPLQCDQWWRSIMNKSNRNRKHEPFEPKFGVKASSILAELYFVEMKFSAIQEIIYQSNPKSLNPIKFYGRTWDTFRCKSTAALNETNEEEDEDGGDWYISSDYNPYQL